MRPSVRHGLAAIVLCAAGTVLAGQEALEIARVGMSLGVIEGVSPADARAATMVWAEGVSGAMGVYKDTEVSTFTSLDDAVRSVGDGRVQLAVLTSLEYLEVERRIACDPSIVYEVQGAVTHEYVLLARATGVRRAPAEASITIFSSSRQQNLPTLWANTHFVEQGVPGGLTRFKQLLPVDKRGRATTAAFFGRSDYGVDTRSAYQSAVELNPQIGRDVIVLARSPELLPGVVCLTRSLPSTQRRQFVERATRLHELGRYRQSLVIMGLTRLVAWDPAMLETTRALVAKHDALTRRNEVR